MFDGGQPLEEEDFALVRALRGKAAIAVINKTDLPQRIDAAYIQGKFQHVVFASARQGGEIPGLAAVRELTGVGQADPDAGLLSGLRQRAAGAAAFSRAQSRYRPADGAARRIRGQGKRHEARKISLNHEGTRPRAGKTLARLRRRELCFAGAPEAGESAADRRAL